jgi:hypothetical protein
MAYSGKTQALLRKVAAAAAKSGGQKPIEVRDAETGEPLVLNRETFAARARAPEPFAFSRLVSAASPFGADPLPDLAGIKPGPAALARIREHHEALLADAVACEAAREAARRELLLREPVDWRQKLMESLFTKERVRHAEELRTLRTKLDKLADAKARE